MIRHIWLRIVAGICLTGHLCFGSPEQPLIRFERLTVDDGLVNASIIAIFQDHRGFLWLGTETGGMQKYDGYRFTTYRNNPDDPNSISNNTVWSISEDPEGNLWIGTAGKVLNKFDPNTELFTRYPCWSDTLEQKGHDNLFSTCVDHTGKIWVGSYGQGLHRFDPATNIFTNFSTEQGLDANSVRALLQTDSNTLWIGTYSGLNKLDLATHALTSYQSIQKYPNGPGDQAVKALFANDPNELWLTGEENGLYRLNTLTNEFTDYPVPVNDSLKISQRVFYAINATNEGYLWLATRGGGLIRFDPRQKVFRRYIPEPGNPNSLSNDIVQSLLLDVAGTLWIGTNNGLNRIDPSVKPFISHNQQGYGFKGLSDNTIWSFTEDSSGHLWIGTWNGLNRYDPENESIEVFKPEPNNPGAIPSNVIPALYTDPKGQVWVGTWMGLSKYHPASHSFTTYRHDKADPTTLSNRTIFAIAEDQNGFLWLGTNKGLNRFDPQRGKAVNYVNGIINGSDRIRALFIRPDGNLWVGTKRGLFLFDPGRADFTHIPLQEDPNDSRFGRNYISALVEDHNHILWIGTRENGLKKLNPQTGKLWRYNENNGVEQSICGIREDQQGNLWISTGNGLFKYDPVNGRFKRFDRMDGLQSNQFNYGAHYINKKGQLFFGGINGYSHFFPEHIHDNPNIPPVVFTGFQIFNKPVPIGRDSPLKKHINNAAQISLTYKQSVFSFEVAALNFTGATKNQYAYFLEGFDQSWNDMGRRRFITFTNLDPGKYTLKVKASNNDGGWNEKGTSIRILITPPFWQTWWFKAFVAIALILIIYLFFRIRVLTYNRDVVRELLRLLLHMIKHKQYITVKGDGGIIRLNPEEVLWIKAAHNYVEIITPHKTYLIRHTMDAMLKLMPVQQDFVRIHRSYIVRLDKVSRLEKASVFVGETQLPAGRAYRKNLDDIRTHLTN